jgi:hypothetical protein
MPPATQGLTYVKSTGHFIAVQEQVDTEKHGLIPYTIEVEIEGDDEGYKVRRAGQGWAQMVPGWHNGIMQQDT